MINQIDRLKKISFLFFYSSFGLLRSSLPIRLLGLPVLVLVPGRIPNCLRRLPELRLRSRWRQVLARQIRKDLLPSCPSLQVRLPALPLLNTHSRQRLSDFPATNVVFKIILYKKFLTIKMWSFFFNNLTSRFISLIFLCIPIRHQSRNWRDCDIHNTVSTTDHSDNDNYIIILILLFV